MKNQSIYLDKPLQNDDVLVSNEVKSLEALTGFPTRKGLEKVIISGGIIVNTVSNAYTHMPNQNIFPEVEIALINAGIDYKTRSINRNNCSFAVDYILNDNNFEVKVKGNHGDEIVPMLRFNNSYDGSGKTGGSFGFFRKICSNGLHVAHTKVGFGVKHKGDMEAIVLTGIGDLVQTFISNEYYDLVEKFETLQDKKIGNVDKWIKEMTERTKLFQYEKSAKNPEPALNARMVAEVIHNEARTLGVKPSLWLGYNAFNQILHDKLKKTFEAQQSIDNKLFDIILETV